MKTATKYIEISEREVPQGLWWDVPPRSQGKIVEIAYGDPYCSESDDGSPYKRIRNYADRTTAYYRLAS